MYGFNGIFLTEKSNGNLPAMAFTGFEGKADEGNSKALGVNRNQIMSPKRDKLLLAALIAEGQQLGRSRLL